MKYLISISILILIVIISCSKSANDKYCWQIVDFNGNNIEMICDKTEAELINCVDNGTCGNATIIGTLGSCNYYKIDGAKYSWMINDKFYKSLYADQARLMAHCYGNNTTPLQVDSNYCKKWYTRKIITFKPNQSTTYSGISSQDYCADSLKTIYQGRKIVLRDVTDSLIVLEFSSDGMHW